MNDKRNGGLGVAHATPTDEARIDALLDFSFALPGLRERVLALLADIRREGEEQGRRAERRRIFFALNDMKGSADARGNTEESSAINECMGAVGIPERETAIGGCGDATCNGRNCGLVVCGLPLRDGVRGVATAAELAEQKGRCGAQITMRDNEHMTAWCTGRAGHPGCHYDSETQALWTDAEHFDGSPGTPFGCDDRERAHMDGCARASAGAAIVRTENVCGGAWRIAGTRIPVDVMKAYARAGWDAAHIREEHPVLTIEQIQAALAFAEPKDPIGCGDRVLVSPSGREGIVEEVKVAEPRWYVRLGPSEAGWRLTSDLTAWPNGQAIGCSECASAGLPSHDRTAEDAKRTCAIYLRERDGRTGADRSAPADEGHHAWPTLGAFARVMHRKLDENAHKGGWDEDPPHLLLARVIEELAELVETIRPEKKAQRAFDFAHRDLLNAVSALRMFGPFLKCGGKPADVAGEAADVANMVMMVADRLGALKLSGGSGERGGESP